MRSESSCGALCQHPECWRANLQRVKDAVRLRNGIQSHDHETSDKKDFTTVDDRKTPVEDGSLPSLKVIDVFGDIHLRSSSVPNSRASPQPNRYHHRSASLPSLSPNPCSQPPSPSCTPNCRVPRPSPVSPTGLTEYQKRMLWKKNVKPASAPYDDNRHNQGVCKSHASIVGIHELYENDELSQDWKDVYITSAYLVWCQPNRRKRRKAKSTGSIRKDPRRVTFKDVTEDMIPAAMEKMRPKRPEPRRSPTVGLPYGPSRSSSHRQVHVQHLDLGKYGLEDFGDFPKSVIAGILQHLKPRSMALDKDLPLGLEYHPKQQSSPRGGETGAKLVTADAPENSLQQTLQDENSRMLLDIDINSHFTPPVGEEITDDEGGDRTLDSPRQGTRPEANMIKAVSEKLAARQGRVLLPLPSIGVPTQRKAKDKLHHCMNSIPHNLDLGVAMEPVDVVSVTPTPTRTPSEDVTAQGSQLNILDRRSMDVTLAASELDSPSDDRWPVRTHITSALRYSPVPVRAPAPTPISPERYGRYSRTPNTREHSHSISSRHMRRWETLSSVYDQDEPDLTREALGSPEGEGEDVVLEPVFLTEDAILRDPKLMSFSNRKDGEQWPQEKMIVNIIEGEEMPRSVRSPSPGSKTYIPQDILAEFHGDLYGRTEMHIAGHKMTGKQNFGPESLISTDVPAYIAPAWRPPRSRTPIQFLETPSRKAPRPLRQPPAESVPKSLTVQSLRGRALRRPKSTPPRIGSPGESSKDLPVQQILSDSSLVHSTREVMDTYSMAVPATSPSVDANGSIPPPPSPEAQIITSVVPSTFRLDPVSEAEEKSSIASASVADGTSHVEGCNAVANLSEVEEENEDVKLSRGTEKVLNESRKEQETAAETSAVAETGKENKEDAQPNNTQLIGEERLSPIDKLVQSADAVRSQTLPEENPTVTKEAESNTTPKDPVNQTDDSERKQEEILSENNTITETSRDNEEETAAPPHPPGSPDIINTPDFTEGLDMNLDLEAELRAAMEGLEDLDDNTDGEGGEKRASPELEAW